MMGERGSRKIPVTDRQFLWVQDDDKGEVILHVGPTMVSPTAADRVVVDDGQGGFREDGSGRPQRMIELSDSQYAVLYNPLGDLNDGESQANGRFKPGRNESRALRNGTRGMIPGPCSFYLRPGQRVEVRDAHELASNQYLVVKVYGQVDTHAPYYEITAKSAAITTATAEEVSDEASTSSGLDGVEPVSLSRGQLIVIRGLDTQFYIPPTGVDVVPDLSVDAEGNKLTASAARRLLASVPRPPPPAAPEPNAGLMAQEAVSYDYDDVGDFEELAEEQQAPARYKKADKAAQAPGRSAAVQQAARLRHQVQRAAPPPPEPPPPADPGLSPDEVDLLLSSDVHRQALEREVRKGRLVRQAVVLSEKEFCVILDADGKRQIKRGPARVFPGPYDSFMTKGSRDRIYNAYELLPQRALWLRFIAPIAKDRLAQRLPRGVELDQELYQPGDEMVLTGVNSFFFPFNEIEILHPLTGRPHVGNEHSEIFIEAIGIDQKSGIYVRDLATGEARLVRGKQSYLVDPRKEVHITRTLSPSEWNLWIAVGEPHKSSPGPVTTPWAVSIVVPHNTAILATSADGQRVVEGPCVELLEYEETLASLALSGGTPKSDDRTVRTCFLRTVGNRVSDVVTLETADFVQVEVRLSYHVTFDREHQSRWFNHENYVGLLCDHLRSLLRSGARQIPLTDLWSNLPNLIRDTILGERTEGGRAGRLFPENGMRVTEVEVLSSEILDDEIAGLLDTVQRESVSLVIGDRQATEQLRSDKLRHQLELERLALQRDARSKKAELELLIHKLEHEAAGTRMRDTEARSKEQAALNAERERMLLDQSLARAKAQASSDVELERSRTISAVELAGLGHTEEQSHRKALAAIEAELIAARSQATVAERQAVQPALVEALSGLGDKVLLSEVAANMNLVSLFKGKDVATLFQEILGGTRVARTIEANLPSPRDD
jgi:major vault protein